MPIISSIASSPARGFGHTLSGRISRQISFLSTPSSNFQIRVVLNTSNFNYSKVKSDGGDIRFYSDQKLYSEIPYYIESWNYNGTSTLWFKVPNSGSTNVYMSYGNNSATTTSNINTTFENGLQFMYYGGTGFSTLDGGGIDTHFNWGWGSGTVYITNVQTGSNFGSRSDSVSIRWKGFVQPSASGTTTFYTTSDDGQRLYLDGTTVINNWSDQGDTERSYSLSWTNGLPKRIQYDWYENGGGATARIGWATPNIAKVYGLTNTYTKCPKYDSKYGDSFGYSATVGLESIV